jgi:type VI secretion system protein ImpJ
MFLRAQHFQQADRWTEHLVRAAVGKLSPYPWGFIEFSIDRGALGDGLFALTGLRGVLPDGTPFDAPGDTDLPPAIELDEQGSGYVIYLALPSSQPGRAELAMNAAGGEAVRFVSTSYEASDANIDTDFSAAINVGRLKLRFLREGEDLSGYTLLGLARITEIRPDRAVILDPDYIPASLNCAAAPALSGLATELLGILRQRATTIASRLTASTLRSTPDTSDYALLQALNRADPMLAHIVAQATRIHPIMFYEFCIALAGELATFTTGTKLAGRLPPYRHEDLKTTFAAVFHDLRASLSVVLQDSALAVPLTKGANGVYTGQINNRTLLRECEFILAVRADLSGEAIRQKVPVQIKVGAVESIGELVNVALPGIGVTPVPVSPRQLLYRTGTVYFELDIKSPLWAQLDNSGAVALHLSGDFPNLEVELWALRQ